VIEKPPIATRSYRPNIPIHVATITINQSATPSTITGDPLVLDFDQIVSRPPNGPNEHDVRLTRQDLDTWATNLWVGI